ncbi:hypothetical protein ANANG_G00299620 [Anguilla anguilla]|uniref:Uncharacterized protein n=1 Tax=Anguilla anguilla TaxID=7936 RepID=A0A9D3LHU7_ANGAN|nr:hypothetical protein ANANG_G00299620 [Anguilla anguilla]
MMGNDDDGERPTWLFEADLQTERATAGSARLQPSERRSRPDEQQTRLLFPCTPQQKENKTENTSKGQANSTPMHSRCK